MGKEAMQPPSLSLRLASSDINTTHPAVIKYLKSKNISINALRLNIDVCVRSVQLILVFIEKIMIHLLDLNFRFSLDTDIKLIHQIA